MSQPEYLKRYLESVQKQDTGKPTKKKVVKKAATVKTSGLKIVDEESAIRVEPKLEAPPSKSLSYSIVGLQDFSSADVENEDEKPFVVSYTEEKRSTTGLQTDGSGWVDLDAAQKEKGQNASNKRGAQTEADDLSPARKKARHDSDDEDLSPVRHPSKTFEDDDGDLSLDRNSASQQKKAGLLSRDEVIAQTERLRQERKARLAQADPDSMGRNAETVYRDKRGRKLSINEIVSQQEKKLKGQDSDEGMEWGKGLVQTKEKEAKQARLAAQTDMPLAIHDDDKELNMIQRETDRWGDPMAHLLKKHKKEKKKKKEKKEKSSHTLVGKMWNVPPPLNRYNIQPGRYWDGVDRSNGFEKKLLSKDANKEAKRLESYLWSVEDM